MWREKPCQACESDQLQLVFHPLDARFPPVLLPRRVDPDAMLVVAEGAVTMQQLVDACLPYGLLPQVVPEIRDFSVAGLLNGLGIESSSHR
jgi:FAD/FMN-containing dehydrogenase